MKGASVGGASRRVAVGCALLLAACAAQKPDSAFEAAFDDQEKPWAEIQTQLPPSPRDADLAQFAVSGATQYRFGVDGSTVDIGSDGVFRYVLVATSPSGVRNVSYEGIRCQTKEKKIYATGRADGTWVRARNAAWSPIEDVGLNRQQAALMKEYFCPDGYPAQSTTEVVSRLNLRPPPTNY